MHYTMKKQKSFFYILLFVAAHFFHHLLTAILIPLLPYIRDGFELSYAQSGGVVSAFALAYGFGQLPSGWVADRIGPRYLFLTGISGVAVVGALIGLSTSYLALIILLILMGILGGGYHPSASPLIVAAVPQEQKGKAIGLHLVGGSGSNFVAPLMAVFIAGFFGWRGAYIAISIPVFLFGIWLFIILLRNDIRASKNPKKLELMDSVSPAKTLKTLPEIVLFLVMSASIGAIIGSSVSFLPLFIVDTYGVDNQTAAWILSLFFGAGVLGGPIGGAIVDRYGPLKIFFILAIFIGPLIYIIGFIPHWVIFAFLMIALGLVAFFRMSASEVFFVDNVPKRHRSTVLGIYFFTGMEANGIITPFLGAAIDKWGFTASFAGIGLILMVVIAVCMVLFFFVKQRLRQHVAP